MWAFTEPERANPLNSLFYRKTGMQAAAQSLTAGVDVVETREATLLGRHIFQQQGESRGTSGCRRIQISHRGMQALP